MEKQPEICPFCGKPMPCTNTVELDTPAGTIVVPYPNARCPKDLRYRPCPPDLGELLEREEARAVTAALWKNYPPTRYRYISSEHLRHFERYSCDEINLWKFFHLPVRGKERYLLKSVRKYQHTDELGWFPLTNPHFNEKGKRRQFATETQRRAKLRVKRKLKWIPFNGKKL